MTPEQWQRVKPLLDRAIELETEERSSFLERACGGDEGLRSEVESLLRSHVRAGTSFLKTPAANLRGAMADAPLTSGVRVGTYEIVEAIGRGGMGEVYRAVRADGQYRKDVAIKLVRVGLDSAFAVERFRNERQILATLDHPNIARLLDGGTTKENVPFLVMELIEGERLDVYCDERRLAITERLQLFRQICAAVQYAHQRLVIHRDIKPSNILVTRDGTPKLLDFGIAKILDPAGGLETTIARPMTPEYASPEQIRGDAITTASDVYSLGVVLFQLVTGRSPYAAETSSSHQLAKAICETDPMRPSTAVLKILPAGKNATEQPIAAEELSAVREGTPSKLSKRLAGDLDQIVLKALRKEPQRRYGSVEQLAEDIGRHLDGLPVLAVKGSFRYRAGKFVRRNRLVLAASALVAISIMGGIAATVRQARIARRQAEIASTERARAERRFGDVRKLANSLIFEINDSIQDLPGATPSRKLLLDRAVEYLDKLSQDAAGDVDLQRELAWGYQRLSEVQGDTSQSNLGQIEAAAISVKKSIGLFESVAKANPNNVTDQLNLANAYRRRAFTDIFEQSGLEEIEQALAITEPLMRDHAESLDVKTEHALELQILASVQDAIGDRMESIETFRKLVQSRQEIQKSNPEYKNIRRGVAKSQVMLAEELGRFGSKEEALQLMNQAIAEMERLVKEGGNPDVVRDYAASRMRRGELQQRRGNHKAALADFREARGITFKLATRDPKNEMLQADLCGFDFNDGRSLTESGRAAEGLRSSTRALQCFRDLHMEADTGPGTGALESWIGEAERRLQRPAEALKHFQAAEKALAADLSTYDDARCDLAMVETKIGRTLLALGKVQEAADYFQKAMEYARVEYSLEHKDIPALDAAVEAYAGMSEVAAARARRSQDAATRDQLLGAAKKSYEKSLMLWAQIPNPSRINGNGYQVENPKELERQLALATTVPTH